MKKITLLKSLFVALILSFFSFSALGAEKTIFVDFSKLAVGEQYAENEKHQIDDVLTIYTTQCHVNTQLRIYSSASHNGFVVSNQLPGVISKMTFNAGNKSDVLLIYGSTDGSAWTKMGSVSVKSDYADYEVSLSGNYTYFKLDVEGENQVRVKTMSVTYVVDDAVKTPLISAMDVDFATLDETNETKIVAVTGENLTEAITATLKTGTAFQLSSDLTAEGGDLTVKFIATAVGTYSDEITLTSGDVTKTIEVSAILVDTDGDGTKENPYTCADVRLLNNGKSGAYWVRGFILGCVNNGILATDIVKTNLALGATKDDENIVSVQLPQGGIRDALNLEDNKNLLAKEVIVYGDLSLYYGCAGVKNVTDYVIVEENGGTATSVDVTTISNIYTLNRTIVAEGEFEIFTITGQNVTGMNGSLADGVYVVRTATAATKVVVR